MANGPHFTDRHAFVEVRVQGLAWASIDSIRALARSCGYSHTNTDVVRFAVAIAAQVAQARVGMTIKQVIGRASRIPRPDLECDPLARPPGFYEQELDRRESGAGPSAVGPGVYPTSTPHGEPGRAY